MARNRGKGKGQNEGNPVAVMKEVYPMVMGAEVGHTEDGELCILTLQIPLPRKEIQFLLPQQVADQIGGAMNAPHVEKATPGDIAAVARESGIAVPA